MMPASNLSVRLIAVLMAASLASAQPQQAMPASAEVGSWKQVIEIKAGSDIRVKRTGVKKPVRGKFVSAGPDTIQFSGSGSVVSISKSDVKRVEVARKKKARNTAIGAAIGGGVGAAILGGIGLAGQREGAERLSSQRLASVWGRWREPCSV